MYLKLTSCGLKKFKRTSLAEAQRREDQGRGSEQKTVGGFFVVCVFLIPSGGRRAAGIHDTGGLIPSAERACVGLPPRSLV